MFTINHTGTINHNVNVKVDVQFKVLDRLLDYLEANDQKTVDGLTEKVSTATTKLQRARTILDQAGKS